MFEDTLTEYHRISTTLASRHDLTEAISVWKEYLRHVESSFLGEAIPGDDYEALSEQCRLGGVHSRILDSHKIMLARQQQVCHKVDRNCQLTKNTVFPI